MARRGRKDEETICRHLPLNAGGYLYDYVDGTYAEPTVRPNMAIAIGLDYSPSTAASARGYST